VWASPSVRGRVESSLPWPVVDSAVPLSEGVGTLIVVGGGSLIDSAKALRRDGRKLRLIAIPSIWGSGAEASRIIVLDAAGRKEILLDSDARPDAIVFWPSLAESISAGRCKEACGDCWAHALEGFLSPLADDLLRGELAKILLEMMELSLGSDPCWFRVGAMACAGQAKSSVGLVHGIAHTIEAPLRAQQPANGWHHARLCAVFLGPVMRLNCESSEKCRSLLLSYAIPEDRMWKVLDDLFDPIAFAQALPVLRSEWPLVLRDRCTRTNPAVVRPNWIDRFS
jgi:alcohol dehydrogenase class IV